MSFFFIKVDLKISHDVDNEQMIAKGRVVETENQKNVVDAISKIKKTKQSQYEEKSIQVFVEEFDLNQEEVLTSLKKTVDNRMLMINNRCNTKILSYSARKSFG